MGLGGLPLLFLLVPATRTMEIGRFPLPWIVLAVVVYPVAIIVARVYVRASPSGSRPSSPTWCVEPVNPAYGVVAIVLVCTVTLAVGAFGLRLSRTTSDFYVAGRTVTPYRNASAIGGEYLSAASFLGIAGLVYTNGLDMLWFPVGYTVGYVVLLVLVAAPLRRSGAYTLPDFAEAQAREHRDPAAVLGARRRHRLALPPPPVPGRGSGPGHA